jgi:hypothetical protein
MDTPTIRKRIKELGGFTTGTKSPDSMELFKSPYIVGPVFILLLLLAVKPSFLYTETHTEKKFSSKKLITYWFIFSLIFVMALYGYNYKKPV